MNGGTDDILVRNQYRESLKSLRLQQSNFSEWLESGGLSQEANFSMVCAADTPCSVTCGLCHCVIARI